MKRIGITASILVLLASPCALAQEVKGGIAFDPPVLVAGPTGVAAPVIPVPPILPGASAPESAPGLPLTPILSPSGTSNPGYVPADPSSPVVPSYHPAGPVAPSFTPSGLGMDSDWGFGAAENKYNAAILQAVSESWTRAEAPLDPRLYKALVATESAFKSNAKSWAGAAGLSQLMPDVATRHGLALGPHDERLDPELALPVGVKVLQEKYQVIMDPGNYWSYLGQPDRNEEWNLKVAEAYQVLGPPEGDDRFYLTLAAYNGGGGTVLRAMAKAYDRGLDPRKWSNLVGPTNRPRSSPLYSACVEVYGRGAYGKYNEISRYPVKIFGYYRR